MTIFAALAGIAGAASAAQQIVIVGLMIVATLLSWWLPGQRVNFSPASAFLTSSSDRLKSLPSRSCWRFSPSTIFASPSVSAQNIGPPR